MTRIIKIMGRDIMVIKVDRIPDDDPDAIGLFEGNTSMIYIKKNLTPHQEKRVLIHELMHAMLCISGQKHHLNSKLEEAICDLVENFEEFITL